MKRVVCLLLCAVMLLSLLPASALADGENQLYFEQCDADGTPCDDGRVDGMNVSYGDTVYFRAYTAKKDGEAVTSDALRLWDDGQNVTADALRWNPSGSEGFYAWNTKTAKTNAPTFSATVNGADYRFTPRVYEADVGWFSSQDKCIASALVYGNEPNANVYYDGSEDVAVYLISESNFVTEISENAIQKDDGIVTELISRGTNGAGVDLGAWLKVTCPKGLSDGQKLSVTVKRGPSWDLDGLTTVTYTVTFSETGVRIEEPSEDLPGEPVLLPGVSINGNQLYLGIGLFSSSGLVLARSGSFTSPSTEERWETYTALLWTKDKEGYSRVGVEHYKEGVIKGWEQLSNITLSSPRSTTGNTSTPEWIQTTEEGWPVYRLGLINSSMNGTWEITASCTLNGKEYRVSCYTAREAANERTIDADETDTVETLNSKIAAFMEEASTETRWLNINLVAGATYTGTIKIQRETGSGRVIVILCGGWKDDVQTTIEGGIRSDNDTLSVQNIHFVGAGKDKTTFEDGAQNSALYGVGRANSVRCTFEGYDKAVIWKESRRMFGNNNVYRDNNIAWYVDNQNLNGGNNDAVGTLFENNNCAIYVQSMGDLQYTREVTDSIRYNRFLNNQYDVQNVDGRDWFIPENYFVHGENEDGTPRLATAIDPATSVSCYPMATRVRNGETQRDDYTYYYNYEQLDYDQIAANQVYRLSNRLTGSYPTPAADLDGKIFEVVDEENGSSALAVFSFPEAQTQSAIATLAAQTDAFDATVSVKRTDDQIILTMNDPCKNVRVKLPCTFENGTVTHDGEKLDGFAFENGSVGFWTAEGGEYVITKSGAEQPQPGELTGCTTVEEINDALKETFANLEALREQEIHSIYVYLSEPVYTGQIVVPERPEGFQDYWLTVIVRGVRQGGVTLHGGIRSNSVSLFAEMLNFVGAGQDESGAYYQKWPEGTANAGEENVALYGDSGGGQAGCTFTGYYYAVKLTRGMRPCGKGNTYKKNHIAWYLGEGNRNGGNFDAEYCVFEGNDIAIQIEKFNRSPQEYAPKYCHFINNTVDAQNNSGCMWFIPENYFVHTDDAGDNILRIVVGADASPVSCFPMRDGEQGDLYYAYEQDADAYLISSKLASDYRIPQASLAGKTFEIVDEDAGQTLAIFTFDETESNEQAFNAAVNVERGRMQISFTMNSTGRPVTVKLPCAFERGTVTCNGKALDAEFGNQYVSFKTNAGGVYVIENSDDEGRFHFGEPTPITVKINGEEKTCWFSVSELVNQRYHSLVGTSMGGTSDGVCEARLAVGLWWDQECMTMLKPGEAAQVMTQADFSLVFYPLSAPPIDPPAAAAPDSEQTEAGMPAANIYLLEAKHEGSWRVAAVCKMKADGSTHTACGELERRVITFSDLYGCTTVEDINNALEIRLQELANANTQRPTYIRVYLTDNDYTGQIVVPEIPESLSDVEIGVDFFGYYSNRALYGGIRSDSAPIFVFDINFIGAGQDDTGTYLESWPQNSVHNGAENSALYGTAMGTATGCTFTGYYYAMKLTENVRLCGIGNTYKKNHIAWYLGEGNERGGNPSAEKCVFEENDIAIYVKKFNLPSSFYAPSRCRFINNKLDIQNDSGRSWFIPGNYFVHGTKDNGDPRLATAISPATSVNCYPLCLRTENGDGYRDTFYYDYEQLDRNQIYELANSLTSAYPTPKEYLDGKTFAVVDEESAETLATFSFPEAQVQTQARIALFAAGIAAFDATVSVERTGDRIVFNMNDPCKPVTVTLPCAFADGTVTHDGNALEAVTFNGEAVSFTAAEGGEYVVTQDAQPSCVIAAGYDKDGQLVGVRFLTDAEQTVEIPGAVTVKRFTLDRFYRPTAQNR